MVARNLLAVLFFIVFIYSRFVCYNQYFRIGVSDTYILLRGVFQQSCKIIAFHNYSMHSKPNLSIKESITGFFLSSSSRRFLVSKNMYFSSHSIPNVAAM